MPTTASTNLSFSAGIARAHAQEREAQSFPTKTRRVEKEPRRVLTIKGDAALELALRTGRVAREAREGRGGEEKGDGGERQGGW